MYGSGTMNRRNLLLGLGTAATLSGAASVTGATFADSVTPTEADFRVIAEANVAVNGVANPTDGGVDNTSQGFVDTGNASNDGGVNFTEINAGDVDTLPVVHADGTTDNDDLTVTLAFETDDATTLSPVLEIDNTGDTPLMSVCTSPMRTATPASELTLQRTEPRIRVSSPRPMLSRRYRSSTRMALRSRRIASTTLLLTIPHSRFRTP